MTSHPHHASPYQVVPYNHREDMMETTTHLVEIPIPEATREALRMLRDERDAARREEARLLDSLKRISDRCQVLSETPSRSDVNLALYMINEETHRARSNCRTARTWRDRIVAWWQTRRA